MYVHHFCLLALQLLLCKAGTTIWIFKAHLDVLMKTGVQEVNSSRNTCSVISSLEAQSLLNIFPLSFALNPSCIERCFNKKARSPNDKLLLFLTLDRNLTHRAQCAYFSSVFPLPPWTQESQYSYSRIKQEGFSYLWILYSCFLCHWWNKIK